MAVDVIREFPIDLWKPGSQAAGTDSFESLLETGKVLYFPGLSFILSGSERRFLSPAWSDGRAKNISYRGETSPLQGAQGDASDIEQLRAMIARFTESAQSLVQALLPAYQPHLKRGFTSYRTAPVANRITSWRKDDTRLHVDAFPSNPTGGKRLLRVFTNVNPNGMARVWRVGEPFPDFAETFFPLASKPLPGLGWLLTQLGITKSRRSEYDHYMGQLHDLGKADVAYQAAAPQLEFHFPAGSTWMVYSDQVLHAVMSGQYMLEQTFYLEPEHLRQPESGPLAILEGLAGRPLRS